MIKWAKRFIISLLAVGGCAFLYEQYLAIQTISIPEIENETTQDEETEEENTWKPIDLLTADVMGKTVNCYQWENTDLVHCLCEGDSEFIIDEEHAGMIFVDEDIKIEEEQGTIADPYLVDEFTDLEGQNHTLSIYVLDNDESIYRNTVLNCSVFVQKADVINNHYEQLDTEQANRIGEIVLNADETEINTMQTIYYLNVDCNQFYLEKQKDLDENPILNPRYVSYYLDVKSNSYGEMFIYDEDTKKTYQIQNEDLFDFKQILESVN